MYHQDLAVRFDVITLFPEQFQSLFDYSVIGRALTRGLAELYFWNPRDFTNDPHRRVDDRPYGGGPGMVLQFAPLRAAIEAAKQAAPESAVVFMSPQGSQLNQERLKQYAQAKGWIFVAGHYEGIDERLLTHWIDSEWSIGDYVLSGGELPAMVVIDALIRLLPGALGHADSAIEDSYTHGLLDCPHYTRPDMIDGLAVPPVLLSGDHRAIARWRLQQALGRTWRRRPDLFAHRLLNEEEQALLAAFIADDDLT
jgi:tRNA (guanine37-N1)-methyltransferase